MIDMEENQIDCINAGLLRIFQLFLSSHVFVMLISFGIYNI